MKNSDFCLLTANVYIAGSSLPNLVKILFMGMWLALGLRCLFKGE
jgi:hypothetical protein